MPKIAIIKRIELEESVWRGLEQIGKRLNMSLDEVLQSAAEEYNRTHYDTIWKEKRSLKKKESEDFRGAIQTSKYKTKEQI